MSHRANDTVLESPGLTSGVLGYEGRSKSLSSEALIPVFSRSLQKGTRVRGRAVLLNSCGQMCMVPPPVCTRARPPRHPLGSRARRACRLMVRGLLSTALELSYKSSSIHTSIIHTHIKCAHTHIDSSFLETFTPTRKVNHASNNKTGVMCFIYGWKFRSE